MAISFSSATLTQTVTFVPSATDNLNLISLAVWINATDYGYLYAASSNEGWIYNKYIAPANGIWAFGLINAPGSGYSQEMRFIQTWSTTFGDWVCPFPSTLLNTKQYCVLTYDRSSVSNNPIIYINGVSQTITVKQAPSGTLTADTGGSLEISGITSQSAFGGKIEDLRIYNRILSSSEVSALYASGSPTSLETNDSGLVFHAPFLIATGMTPPWNGNTIGGTNKLLDRINCVQGTPSGSPVGASDFVYGTSY